MVKTIHVDRDFLEDYIKNSGFKVSYLADQLGISLTAFYKKLDSKIAFRASEVFTLCVLLGISNEDKKKIFIIE